MKVASDLRIKCPHIGHFIPYFHGTGDDQTGNTFRERERERERERLKFIEKYMKKTDSQIL
jgi:hypothetical protein